ncbi:YihY/virulence factor BrkB family protein [Mycoplasmopsis columbina]|uniref:Uncharacterized protein n=1 Tax=Mycoplasmopsis columbina SF7 TaxID=1037410 RepID=F9UJ50_9BACT|nr:YhjD/YihY/BrkB family envelope integrity protein [Mycoplasmopsis columbina]EGV00546.1 hypothetical protein MCSF7_02539 [Mycoplasmopsis columbina SF7]VEU77159.1 Ribonuclease BN-like family [Mycoplasmopsis columbina]
MKNNKKNILTGLQQKDLKKSYRNSLKKSWLTKNIIPINKNRWSFIEEVIKFFLKIILKIATPKIGWKNKIKTKELINRTYDKFISKDLVFIPLSLSFYFLISFVPIITIIMTLLSLIDGYNQIFIQLIMSKIIPGIQSILDLQITSKSHEGLQYISIIFLLLASLWLSSNGFAKFVYSQNYIYKHEFLGNWFTNRLKGLFIVMGISIYLFLGIALYILIYSSFVKVFTNNNSQIIFFYSSFSVYLLIFLYLGTLLLFKLTPSFKVPFTSIFPGVLVAVLPIWIFIMSFGYLTSLINYSKYGLIGTFMYVALFVSTLSYCLMLGIIVNEAYYKTYYSSYTIAKKNWIFWKIKF